jgi:hypothetical protein
VALAARGARNLDRGDETVSDAAERAALRRKARRVHLESILAAGALTALGVAFPD